MSQDACTWSGLRIGLNFAYDCVGPMSDISKAVKTVGYLTRNASKRGHSVEHPPRGGADSEFWRIRVSNAPKKSWMKPNVFGFNLLIVLRKSGCSVLYKIWIPPLHPPSVAVLVSNESAARVPTTDAAIAVLCAHHIVPFLTTIFWLLGFNGSLWGWLGNWKKVLIKLQRY